MTGRELSRQGISAMEMGHWTEAENLLRKALDESPNDAVTRKYLAEALWHRRAAPEAILQMETALRLDPHNAELTVRVGEMLLAGRQAAEALAHAEQAIDLDPSSAAAWALRGRAYLQFDEPEQALADLQRALTFAPTADDVLFDVATIYRQRGQLDRCLVTLHYLLDLHPPGEQPQHALWLEGRTLVDLGRWSEAADSLQAASERGPPNADILYWLAEAQFAGGRAGTADQTARAALAADASHRPSRDLLVRLSQYQAAGGTHLQR